MPNPAAALYNAVYKPNPYQNNVNSMANTIASTPNDPYGYSAMAKIPLQMYMGQQMGQSQNFEDQRTQAAGQAISDQQSQQQAQSHITSLFNLTKVDPAAANEYKNELVKTGDKNYQFLANVNFTAKTDTKNWMHIDLGDKQVSLHPQAMQNQQLMTLLGKPNLSQDEINQINSTGLAAVFPKNAAPGSPNATGAAMAAGAKQELTAQADTQYMQDNPQIQNPQVAGVANQYNPDLQSKMRAVDLYAGAGTAGDKRISDIVKPQKQVERTVDLGDRVETHYTDGTIDTQMKGRVPTQEHTHRQLVTGEDGKVYSVDPANPEAGAIEVKGVKKELKNKPRRIGGGTPSTGAAVSAPQEGQTATNPKTGQKIIFKGGQWQIMQ